jgi:lipoprotein-anchoring transpeptidase ErfK/SrfK
MRYLVALVILLLGAVGGVLVYRHLTAGPAIVLPKPRQLVVAAADGTPLLPGGWTHSSSLALKAEGLSGVVAGLDVELRAAGRRFVNTPNRTVADPGQVATTCKTCIGGAPPLHVHLADGHYHWQARLHNGQGISPWALYHGTINVDTQPPAPATITSATDLDPKQTYHSSSLEFGWQSADYGSGIAGYSYRLDKDPHGSARAEIRTNSTSVKLSGLDTGTYYFHVRAIDSAGNWNTDATFSVKIDVTPPGLTGVTFSHFAFNPTVDTLGVSFGVTRPAQTVRVGVYGQGNGHLVRMYQLQNLAAGQRTGVAWDGKDAQGRYVGAGAYMVYIRALDRYGHYKVTGWRDFIINYRRIVVSLSTEKLVAYEGDKVFLTSLVTTGNKALPTPTGTFHIMAKLHPFTFISPWPKSSPYYYKPSKTQFAMLFREGGYFIHDAPWRTAFGPGTNAAVGTPGSNYTGTHGCVNVPSNVAARLFAWAPIGTVVEVVP